MQQTINWAVAKCLKYTKAIWKRFSTSQMTNAVRETEVNCFFKSLVRFYLIPSVVNRVLDRPKLQKVVDELHKSPMNLPKDSPGLMAFKVFDGLNPRNIVNEMFKQAVLIRSKQEHV